MKISEKAVELHSKGYNCAQCVLLACSDHTGLSHQQAAAVAEGFGGGVKCGEICGAISGAVMAAGLALNAGSREDKMKVSGLTKEITETFRDKCGAVRCRELKGKSISCNELIALGAETAERLLSQFHSEAFPFSS